MYISSELCDFVVCVVERERTDIDFSFSCLDSTLLHIFSKYGGLKLVERSTSRFHREVTVYTSGYNWVGHRKGLGVESVTSSTFMVGT